ncbi:hypothetical protein [Cohnella abietis]|uniref:Uncharacterized protein n=1 Tax=Cohnella abietis TaxID=2507935 RepID=A0A3T1CYC3_9BACL|nr:hypothetical protein [Cohnella abietis]BBI30745.1 hypothetical protein KCTCHS21_01440 [Cohnella abietis]
MKNIIKPITQYHWGNVKVKVDKVENWESSEGKFNISLMLNGNTHSVVAFTHDFVLYSYMIAELHAASLERMPWVEDWMLSCKAEELREQLSEGEMEELAFYKDGQETRESLIKLLGTFAFHTLSRFVENRSNHEEIDNELDLRLVLHELGISSYEEQNDFMYWKPTSTICQ